VLGHVSLCLLPGIRERASPRRVVLREAAHLERAVDGVVEDAEGLCWLKSEAAVVVGITEKSEQWPALAVSSADQLGHQRTADTTPLPARMDCDRGYGCDGTAVQVGSACEYVTDDGVIHNGDELQPHDCGAEAADVVDDPNFVFPASECLANDAEDVFVVGCRWRAHLHGVASNFRYSSGSGMPNVTSPLLPSADSRTGEANYAGDHMQHNGVSQIDGDQVHSDVAVTHD
jgi:hypothetical protein